MIPNVQKIIFFVCGKTHEGAFLGILLYAQAKMFIIPCLLILTFSIVLFSITIS